MTISLPLDYGRMQRPEDKRSIDLADNPVQAALAVYRQWLPLVPEDADVLEHNEETFFREAEALLKPHHELLQKATNKDLNDIIASISIGPHAGYIASAVHNASGVETLEGVFSECDNIGYRLNPGKKVVLLPGSRVFSAGAHSRGTVINYGELTFLGIGAEGGCCVNYGTAINLGRLAEGMLMNFGHANFFGERAKNAALLNFGRADFFQGFTSSIAANLHYAAAFGTAADDSIAFNLHIAQKMGKGAAESVFVNSGRIAYTMGINGPSNVNVNAGSCLLSFNSFIAAQGNRINERSKPYRKIFVKMIENAMPVPINRQNARAEDLVSAFAALYRLRELMPDKEAVIEEAQKINWQEISSGARKIAEELKVE